MVPKTVSDTPYDGLEKFWNGVAFYYDAVWEEDGDGSGLEIEKLKEFVLVS